MQIGSLFFSFACWAAYNKGLKWSPTLAQNPWWPRPCPAHALRRRPCPARALRRRSRPAAPRTTPPRAVEKIRDAQVLARPRARRRRTARSARGGWAAAGDGARARAAAAAVRAGGVFKVAMFADLHYGENAWTDWGPTQDAASDRIMAAVLDAKNPGPCRCRSPHRCFLCICKAAAVFISSHSTQLCLSLLDSDFVVYLGDLVTANNLPIPNASLYWDRAISASRSRGVPWAAGRRAGSRARGSSAAGRRGSRRPRPRRARSGGIGERLGTQSPAI